MDSHWVLNSGDFLLLCHLNHNYIINHIQFLLLQVHLQTSLLQYLMKLMVLLMCQLQLIGIKTNLESFAITILMEHMLNQHQLPLFLWVSKQWGKSTSTGEYVTHTFPIKFTVIPIVVAGALTSNTSGNTGSQSNPCYRSITVSNFVFCMYDNARGYAGSTYIAIGY